MFIRDQEQCELINMDLVYSICVSDGYYIYLYYPDGRTHAGLYKTEKRAKEIINEIAQCYASGVAIYNMPKE